MPGFTAAKLAADRRAAERLEAFFGIDAGSCALPGHQGVALVGWWRDGFQYGCDCLGWMPGVICPKCGDPREHCHCSPWLRLPCYFRPLGDAHHAIWTGRELGFEDRLPGALRAIWWLLLEHDAGLRSVTLPDLRVSPDANDTERRAAEFFAVKHGLEASAGYDRPIPFPVRLVEDRLRVTRDEAHQAIKALREHGTIAQDGRHGQTFLYRPGAEWR
jgi:hypothetical protein